LVLSGVENAATPASHSTLTKGRHAMTGPASVALDKLAIRETIEDYLNFLDAKDWDSIASCFSDDAKSWYNLEPQVLEGGRGVADWLCRRISQPGPQITR